MNLVDIQKKLKAPKSQYNSFGKYKYRSLEDILEAVKGLIDEPIIFNDEIKLIGERYYVESRVMYKDHYAVGIAREPLSKKGMDDAQVTGTTTSYARKFACQALFLIDDTDILDGQDNSAEDVPDTLLEEARYQGMLNAIKDGKVTLEECINKLKEEGKELSKEQIKEAKNVKRK